MKGYVIKNKKGKYWSGHKWETNLIFAYIFPEKTAMLNDDEVWQEITIVEGNLESNQNQKAIECLKEVLDKVSKTKKHYSRDCGDIYSYDDIEDFIDYIDDKIKELEKNDE